MAQLIRLFPFITVLLAFTGCRGSFQVCDVARLQPAPATGDGTRRLTMDKLAELRAGEEVAP